MAVSRAHRGETIAELIKNIASLFPDARYRHLADWRITRLAFPQHGSRFGKRPAVSRSRRTLAIPVVEPGTGTVAAAVSFTLHRQLDEHDITVASAFTRTFNADVAHAPDWEKDRELWLSLQQTRFSRTIGRIAGFSTDTFVRWLRSLENAQSLRHEGKAFAMRLILTKRIQWVKDNPAITYLRFTHPVSVEKALFHEKWVRALAYEGDVTLVGLGRYGNLSGACQVSDAPNISNQLIPPHSDLTNLCAALVPGTAAFIGSPSGDMYLLFPTGITFVKTQGRWYYSKPNALLQILGKYLSQEAVAGLVRMLFDLSYERKGALICVLPKGVAAAQVVPDFEQPERTNRLLRNFAARLSTGNPGHAAMLRNVASVDGAILLAANGQVVDAACMVGEPPIQQVHAAGFSHLKRFEGARTTAAWNCSLSGLAIKVSEDGPISVFERGRKILQIA